MKKELSPHAATILTLLTNASELSVIHHEYVLARDVMRAMQKICSDFGFEVENGVFGYIVDAIGSKPPQALRLEFDRFANMIVMMDRKLDKEPLAGDYKYVRPIIRN